MSEIRITTDNFTTQVSASPVPVLIDFWAPWCGPCRRMSPIISQIAEEHPEIRVGKVNVDEEPQLAAMFGISSIPTVITFKDGKPHRGAIGLRPKKDLLSLLED